MSMLYLVSDGVGNIVGRGPVAPVASSQDANFPITALYDNKPWLIWRAAAIAADETIKQLSDLLGAMILAFGDEGVVWGAGWIRDFSGAGAAVGRTTTVGEYHSAPDGVTLTAGAGYASIYKDVTVRAGESLKLDGWIRASGGGTCRLRVQNLKTGKYYDGAAWGAAVADVFTEAGTVMTEHSSTFTVEDTATCGDWTNVTLRVMAICSGATGVGYVDDLVLLPGVNFCSMHGTNLGPVVSPILQSSDDNAVWTDRITMAIHRPAFYGYSATTWYALYWRVKLAGTPDAIPYVGQLVIGSATTALQPQSWGWGEDDEWPQVEGMTAAGGSFRYAITDAQARSLTLQFPLRKSDLAQLEQLRKDLWARTQGGVWPLVLAPLDTMPSVVFGRVDKKLSVQHRFLTAQAASLTVAGMPSPVVGV